MALATTTLRRPKQDAQPTTLRTSLDQFPELDDARRKLAKLQAITADAEREVARLTNIATLGDRQHSQAALDAEGGRLQEAALDAAVERFLIDPSADIDLGDDIPDKGEPLQKAYRRRRVARLARDRQVGETELIRKRASREIAEAFRPELQRLVGEFVDCLESAQRAVVALDKFQRELRTRTEGDAPLYSPAATLPYTWLMPAQQILQRLRPDTYRRALRARKLLP